MTDEDKCSVAAKLFYQHIANHKKKNPNFVVDDLSDVAYNWAMECGFDHPRCFVSYIVAAEQDRPTM